MRKARKPLLDEFHKRFYAIVAVEDVRRVDLRLEHQPLGVHKQMALRVPFTFLPASKPRSSAPTPPVVLTLWLSTMPALGCGFSSPSGHAPCGAVPRAAPPKCRRCARRGGSHGRPSSTAGSRHAGASARCSCHAPHRRQSVEDLAQRVHPGASGSSRGGEVGLDQGPLGVGEIGLVCSSHHARYPTGPPLHDPFSDGFSALQQVVPKRRELHSRPLRTAVPRARQGEAETEKAGVLKC
jgi:hypothetical protein